MSSFEIADAPKVEIHRIAEWLNKPAYLMTPLDNFLTWAFAVVGVGLVFLVGYLISNRGRR